MALIVKIDRTNNNGRKALEAVELIRSGLGRLKELDGVRGEAIGASATEMATIFGVASDAQAQALSDRWSALLAAVDDSGNAEFTKLRDIVNATVSQ